MGNNDNGGGADKDTASAEVLEWRRKKEARLKRQQQQEKEESSLFLSSLGGKDDDAMIETAAKRRKLEQEQLLSASSETKGVSGRRKQVLQQLQGTKEPTAAAETAQQDTSAASTSMAPPLIIPASAASKPQDDAEGTNTESSQPELSLFEKAVALNQEEKDQASRAFEETRILREASQVQTNALQAASEVAHGVLYKNPMPSTWRPPRFAAAMAESIRSEHHMLVQGDAIPPPLTRFVDMKLPQSILDCLQSKGIQAPTPIQIQGLPVALAGRDMVGIAFTGSGKTLTFTLPLALLAASDELRMPLLPREGPLGILLAPSRELARQTFELLQELCAALAPSALCPTPLRLQLMIGGEPMREQLQLVAQAGVHAIVATPGRLRDVLKRKAVSLENCRYICLDEADRMLDLGFDEEVGDIMNFFPYQRQTLLFSATFPKKFQDFARNTLVKPVVVNVGRAGAANLDVIQEVEYVKDEAKIVYLLHCLQKTAPPVIIFCERKGAADDIHEYLLLKGVEAVSIHGGKDQAERNEAIRLFKAGQKDVLIATDIAAKGLDFPAIQHVINFDMPSEIENYVHRIGRTGRAGKTGVATTFINRGSEETTLLDLKALLQEARQRIPPVLEMLEDPRAQYANANSSGTTGCAFCGGLGHTVVDCPKIDKDARRVAGNQRDVITGGEY